MLPLKLPPLKPLLLKLLLKVLALLQPVVLAARVILEAVLVATKKS